MDRQEAAAVYNGKINISDSENESKKDTRCARNKKNRKKWDRDAGDKKDNKQEKLGCLSQRCKDQHYIKYCPMTSKAEAREIVQKWRDSMSI